LTLSACIPVAPPPTATMIPPTALPPSATALPPTEAPPTIPALPTDTAMPLPTATPPFDLNDGNKKTVFDFTARLCEAHWLNSGERNLPCPGDLNDPSHGYVGLLSGSDQGLPADFAMLVMYPAQPSSTVAALFGRFPKFKPGPFDSFHAYLACRSDANCNIEFSLAYYDQDGKYQEPYKVIPYKQGEPPVAIAIPLGGGVAGKSVEFVLAIRSMGSDPSGNWAVLIAPRILRP